jgi:hypothetical protein
MRKDMRKSDLSLLKHFIDFLAKDSFAAKTIAISIGSALIIVSANFATSSILKLLSVIVK